MLREVIRKRREEKGITGIIQENPIAISGERISVNEIRDLRGLKIVRGKTKGDAAGTWYRVTFGSSVKNAEVVCTSEAIASSIPTTKLSRKTRPTWSTTWRRDFRSRVRDELKASLKIPWPISLVTGWFMDTFVYAFADWIGYLVGLAMQSMWDDTLKKQFDYIEYAINDVIPNLYSAWGVSSSRKLSSVVIRNVTSSGFEFLSQGSQIVHWIAMGER